MKTQEKVQKTSTPNNISTIDNLIKILEAKEKSIQKEDSAEIDDIITILEKREYKELNSNTSNIEFTDLLKKEFELVRNEVIKSDKNTEEKLEHISKKQEEVLSQINTIKRIEPSNELNEIFTKYKFDFNSVVAYKNEKEIDLIIQNIQSDDFKKNVKLIAKCNDEKLKSNYNQYKSIATEPFLENIKKLKVETYTDNVFIGQVINELYSLTSAIKRMSEKHESQSAKA
ncbi:hypothetical protein [Galbibacter sp. BG1]